MGKSNLQRRMEILKAVERINNVVKDPQFLKFAGIYADRFIMNDGFGRWIVEYQDMENKGMFEPAAIRREYIKIILDQSSLDFQRSNAIYYIGVDAECATKAYLDNKNALYCIVTITGEMVEDEDDEPYKDLSHEEAKQICDSLNEEAEEIIFKVKKQ